MSEFNRAVFEAELRRIQSEQPAAEDAAKWKAAAMMSAEIAEKALAQLAAVQPLIEAAWRFARNDVAEWELIHHAKVIGALEVTRRNKLT